MEKALTRLYDLYILYHISGLLSLENTVFSGVSGLFMALYCILSIQYFLEFLAFYQRTVADTEKPVCVPVIVNQPAEAVFTDTEICGCLTDCQQIFLGNGNFFHFCPSFLQNRGCRFPRTGLPEHGFKQVSGNAGGVILRIVCCFLQNLRFAHPLVISYHTD